MSLEKRVDESWKEQVEKERQLAAASLNKPAQQQTQQPQQAPQAKQQPRQGGQPQQPQPRARPGEPPGGEFGMFLSSLSMQALVALGEMAHPATGLAHEDLEQARYLIDVLGMLQEKTQGNLNQEEAAMLDGVLYELRMKYVERTQAQMRPPQPPPAGPRR